MTARVEPHHPWPHLPLAFLVWQLAWNLTEFDRIILSDLDLCMAEDPLPWLRRHAAAHFIAFNEMVRRVGPSHRSLPSALPSKPALSPQPSALSPQHNSAFEVVRDVGFSAKTTLSIPNPHFLTLTPQPSLESNPDP
jgi:hypothetical protein